MLTDKVKAIGIEILDRALDLEKCDPSTARGVARIIASSTVVLCAGITIALGAYIRAGFMWPAELRDNG